MTEPRPILEVDGVGKAFGRVTVLKSGAFSIYPRLTRLFSLHEQIQTMGHRFRALDRVDAVVEELRLSDVLGRLPQDIGPRGGLD